MRVETSDGVYEVRWFHTNNHTANRKKSMTECLIVKHIDENLKQAMGNNIAKCSKRDNFCKETGRKVSLARAIEAFDKPVRTEIWKAYLNRKVKDGSNN